MARGDTLWVRKGSKLAFVEPLRTVYPNILSCSQLQRDASAAVSVQELALMAVIMLIFFIESPTTIA